MAERGWVLLAALLAKLSMLAWLLLPTDALDWQPALWRQEPWRLWTAALAHLSLLHLAANLAGCAVLALLGWRAACRGRDAGAWLLAWPLTQLGLLLRPDLLRYAGLSGVLHAGVAVAALGLMARGGRERRVGAGIALGLSLKIALENPLGPAVQAVPGWDIDVAPFAHLSGAVAGLAAWALVWVLLAALSARAARQGRQGRLKG